MNIKINRNVVIGSALFAAAVTGLVLATGSTGDYAARFVGKAVWYAPYAALVGALRFFAHA